MDSRKELVDLLENLCNKYSINFHNVGKILENSYDIVYLQDYMSDGTHYSKDISKIKSHLIECIYN